VFILASHNSEFVKSRHIPQITQIFPFFLIRTLRTAGHFIYADAPSDSRENVKMYLDNLLELSARTQKRFIKMH